MSWIEAKSGVLFIFWDKLKEGYEKDDGIVMKIGDELVGTIDKIDEIKNKDGEIENYKYTILCEQYEKPVLLWSNASLRRQHEELQLREGEKIKLVYENTYKTKQGKTGRNIKLNVYR